jgi:hypothetical protein
VNGWGASRLRFGFSCSIPVLSLAHLRLIRVSRRGTFSLGVTLSRCAKGPGESCSSADLQHHRRQQRPPAVLLPRSLTESTLASMVSGHGSNRSSKLYAVNIRYIYSFSASVWRTSRACNLKRAFIPKWSRTTALTRLVSLYSTISSTLVRAGAVHISALAALDAPHYCAMLCTRCAEVLWPAACPDASLTASLKMHMQHQGLVLLPQFVMAPRQRQPLQRAQQWRRRQRQLAQ